MKWIRLKVLCFSWVWSGVGWISVRRREEVKKWRKCFGMRVLQVGLIEGSDQFIGMSPTKSRKNWVMRSWKYVPNGWGIRNWGILSDEWWVMNEWWVTKIKWWVMSNKKKKKKKNQTTPQFLYAITHLNGHL